MGSSQFSLRMQSQSQTISNESLLQHLLDGSVDIHGARGVHNGGRGIISLHIRHVEFLDESSLVEVNQAILAWSF
jgi:hypothetical protein